MSKLGGLIVRVKSKLAKKEHRNAHVKIGWLGSLCEAKSSRERTQRHVKVGWFKLITRVIENAFLVETTF